MTDRVEDLSRAFERFPGIGPRQAKRFVYHLLSISESDRLRMANLIQHLGVDVKQCAECMRFWSGNGTLCNYCSDTTRDDSILMIVEKDQDLIAVERANTYRGRYFVLGGVLTLSGKGQIRERELVDRVERRVKNESNEDQNPNHTALREIVLALSATNEGEHTADRVREVLTPLRAHLKLSTLGRGLSTGSELEYADAETLSGALQNRKET
jgi:recombination protein RecR